jgi:endonuclease III
MAELKAWYRFKFAGGKMVRGVVPRQPAKTGRHEGARALRRGAQSRGTSRQSGSLPSRSARKPKSAGKSRGAAGKAYNPVSAQRIQEILKRLDELYPTATCALTHRSAWELLVATILSAQSTDANVNRVTPALLQKYPTVQDFAALEPEQLEPDIRSTGFFRNKSKSVVGAARKIVTDFGGEVPCDIESLLTLPGVARKTANVVLGTWFKKGVGVVVDTHVTRLSHRLELSRNMDAPKIEQDLMKVIPPERWILFSHQLIWHGRQLCMARRPKCVDCALENICHAADKTWTTVEIHKGAKP